MKRIGRELRVVESHNTETLVEGLRQQTGLDADIQRIVGKKCISLRCQGTASAATTRIMTDEKNRTGV